MENRVSVLSSDTEIEARESASGHAWIVLFVTYFGAVVCYFNYFKVPPLMPLLMGHFKTDLASSALMMSVVSIAGLALALPAGALIQKIGLKTVSIVAMAACIAGCLLGAMVANYPIFLISRVFEGIGYALMAIVGPTVPNIWFPRKRVGLAMGITNTSLGVGGFLAMWIAPRMASHAGWQSVWWFTAGVSFLALVAAAIFVRMPPWMQATSVAGPGAPEGASMGEVFANRSIWTMSMAMMFSFMPLALFVYYVTYLTNVQGYPLEKAGLISSLNSVGLLFGAPLGGYLLGKLGNLKKLFTAAALLYCALLAVAFHISGAMLPVWMTVTGAVGMGCVPVLTMTSVPGIIRKPELIALGVAIVGLGGAAAGMLAPILFGAIVDKAGWNAASYALVLSVLAAIVCANVSKIVE